MEHIYSKVDPTKLIHIIVRVSDFKPGRQDVVPPEHFLQCSILNMEEGKTFRPHKHIWKERTRKVIAQESWVVIKGEVNCIFYDIDDTIIATPTLQVGDASFTLEGGHTYKNLKEGSLVYEFKTGPYEGQKLDKTFLDGNN